MDENRPVQDKQPDQQQPRPHAIANELTQNSTVQARGDADRVEEEPGAAVDERERRFGGAPGGPEPGPVPVRETQADELAAVTTLPSDRPRDEALSPAERRIGREALAMVAGVLLIAVILSALLMRQWTLLSIGVLLLVPLIIFFLAPYWLASSTKIAQDEAVRQQREAHQQTQQPPTARADHQDAPTSTSQHPASHNRRL